MIHELLMWYYLILKFNCQNIDYFFIKIGHLHVTDLPSFAGHKLLNILHIT